MKAIVAGLAGGVGPVGENVCEADTVFGGGPGSVAEAQLMVWELITSGGIVLGSGPGSASEARLIAWEWIVRVRHHVWRGGLPMVQERILIGRHQCGGSGLGSAAQARLMA